MPSLVWPAVERGGSQPVTALCPPRQGYRQKDYFIATQGPLAHTVEDFWRMVWEWRCHTIVMLTEVQEREQVRRCPPHGAASPCMSSLC